MVTEHNMSECVCVCVADVNTSKPFCIMCYCLLYPNIPKCQVLISLSCFIYKKNLMILLYVKYQMEIPIKFVLKLVQV